MIVYNIFVLFFALIIFKIQDSFLLRGAFNNHITDEGIRSSQIRETNTGLLGQIAKSRCYAHQLLQGPKYVLK